MSTARFNTLQDVAGANQSTTLQIQQGRAKAWLNLNGTGTIAVRDSFNVGSIVDNGVGDYTAIFTNPMPNATHSPNVTGMINSGANAGIVSGLYVAYSGSTVSVRFGSHQSSVGEIDLGYIIMSTDGD